MTVAKKAITLSLSLSDSNFQGLGRRKYTEKYTKVPVAAYPEDVKLVFEALYKLNSLELTDETSCLSVLASEEGFPQRLIGPKVFQKDGVLGLKLNDLYAFTQVITEDEIKYNLNGKPLTLQAEGKQPVFKLTLGGGLAIKFPIYMNKKEDEDSYYGFSDLEEALSVADNKSLIEVQVGAPSTGGGSLFSALKHLPISLYKVLSTKNETGKYGPVLAMVLETIGERVITVQEKNAASEKWELVEMTVPAKTKLSVQGNTSLKNSLMGTVLTEEDNVCLSITSKNLNKDNNVVVACFFDYTNSRLKFEF